MAIQTVTINVEAQPTADRIQTFLLLSQNENGRQIRFRILGDELPAGCTATLSGEKPDGKVWSKAGTVSDNFVTVNEDIQMTAVAGRWDAQLDIVHGSENIVTAPIRITIEPASVDAGAVPSDTQLEGYVEQCKQYAETAKDEAYGSPLTAATAAAMTDQKRVYVYTGSETGYTAGHWYYYNGSAWTDGGVYNSVAVDTDTTLTIAGKAADAKETGDQITELKSGFNDAEAKLARTPSMLNSDSESDLDVADLQGNVILRLADGEIQTKNFNSANALTQSDLAEIPSIAETEEYDPDLDVADVYGNVLVRVENGEIETKKFRGFPFRTYRSETQVYSGTLPFTLTVNHHFSKGDRIVLHVEHGAKPWAYGSYVNYYVGNKKVFDERRFDCAWIEYLVTEDVDSVSAVYTGAVSTVELTSGTAFTLEVSLLGDIPIRPTVVTVKQDGTGDFTTLRGALDAIGTKANDVLNPYRIEIHKGVYDVLTDYTDEEIGSAAYTQTDFVGPKLLNGMYLVGMGQTPDEVVLTASLDPNTWSNTIRGAISTLNCQGSCGFENLTIEAYNIRYCVHDDYHTTLHKKVKRLVKNCVFRGYGISYTPSHTYGAATTSSGGDFTFINCDFGEVCSIHTLTTIQFRANIHCINCTGSGFIMGEYETDPVETTGYNVCRFDGCGFPWIKDSLINGASTHVKVTGSGNKSPIYQLPSTAPYITDDITLVPNASVQLSMGAAVERYANTDHGPRFRTATSAKTVAGVVVYKDDNDTYIQTKGYVRTDRCVVTGFALGDYIGLVNGVADIVSDASDAFGQIAYIDNTGAGYIKLKG